MKCQGLQLSLSWTEGHGHYLNEVDLSSVIDVGTYSMESAEIA